MTGVALTGRAPYKSVFVHGFTLDEAGNKMSKSLGNVVDPRGVVDARGVDLLRWWVGLHASSSTSVPVGDKVLAASQLEVNKIRNTLKFFLGVLNGFPADSQSVGQDELFLLDRILLLKVARLQDRTADSYARREYNKGRTFLSCSPVKNMVNLLTWLLTGCSLLCSQSGVSLLVVDTTL